MFFFCSKLQHLCFVVKGDGDYEPQPLYQKSRYMSPFGEGYDKQRALDEIVAALPAFDDYGSYGPPPAVFVRMLKEAGYVLVGDTLQRR